MNSKLHHLVLLLLFIGNATSAVPQDDVSAVGESQPLQPAIRAENERERRRGDREEKRRQAEIRRAQRDQIRRDRAERRRLRQQGTSSDSEDAEEVSLQWLASNITELWKLVRSIQQTHPGSHLSTASPQTGNLNNYIIRSSCNPSEYTDCQYDERRCISASGTICADRGECCCGYCQCPQGYSGRFCECHENLCPLTNGEMCGGHGICGCGGDCICHEGWTGDNCDCSLDTTGCIRPGNGRVLPICSGNGECICGQCSCQGYHEGVYCELSAYAAEKCGELRKCVLCFLSGPASPYCIQCQADVKKPLLTRRVSTLESSTRRCRMVHQGCLMEYSYTAIENDGIEIQVPENLECE